MANTDFALITEARIQTQELLSRVDTEKCKVGLRLNTKKTEILEFNRDTHDQVYALESTPLKIV